MELWKARLNTVNKHSGFIKYDKFLNFGLRKDLSVSEERFRFMELASQLFSYSASYLIRELLRQSVSSLLCQLVTDLKM